MSTTLLAVMIFLSVYILILSFYNVIYREERWLRHRLKEMVTNGPHQRGLSLEKEDGKERTSFFKRLVEKTSTFFVAKSYSVAVEKELIKAGIPLKGEEFIAIRLLASCGTGLFLWLISGDIIIGLIFFGIVFAIPKFIIKYAQGKRMEKFNAQIGDCLVIMSNSLKAGFSFLQAMEMVGKEMPNPISGEFSRVLREINLGTPTEEALQHLAERVGSDDIDLVVTAVLIQRQVGGNLSEVLDNISFTIRERIRIKGEIRALTAQGKISGIIIGLLPVILGLALFLINRSYIIQLFTTTIGLTLVVGGVVSQLLGLFFIKKIVDIEV